MEKQNKLSYRLYGPRALFTTPDSKLGGEKLTYQIPTYQALVGVTSSIYWKPTILWVIDRLRVLRPISMESVGIKLRKMKGGIDLSYYTYLRDVVYEVEAHFEWNSMREDLVADRNEHKHYFMAQRSLARGGRYDVFLGTRESQGYVAPCAFGEEEGAYDDVEELHFGCMFHSFTYPSDDPAHKMTAHFWHPAMRKGVVEFPRPEACPIHRELFTGSPGKAYHPGKNLRSVEEEVTE